MKGPLVSINDIYEVRTLWRLLVDHGLISNKDESPFFKKYIQPLGYFKHSHVTFRRMIGLNDEKKLPKKYEILNCDTLTIKPTILTGLFITVVKEMRLTAATSDYNKACLDVIWILQNILDSDILVIDVLEDTYFEKYGDKTKKKNQEKTESKSNQNYEINAILAELKNEQLSYKTATEIEIANHNERMKLIVEAHSLAVEMISNKLKEITK